MTTMKKEPYGDDYILYVKGGEANYDMIRSFDVMLSFLPQVVWHRKSRKPVSICFLASTLEHDREMSVIPVQQGNERMLTRYASDKFDNEKSEIVIFLLETKVQMKLIKPTCNYRYALITSDGVVFSKAVNKTKNKGGGSDGKLSLIYKTKFDRRTQNEF